MQTLREMGAARIAHLYYTHMTRLSAAFDRRVLRQMEKGGVFNRARYPIKQELKSAYHQIDGEPSLEAAIEF